MFASRPTALKARPRRERCGKSPESCRRLQSCRRSPAARAIDGNRKGLGLSGIGLQDDQLIDDVVAAKVVVDSGSTFRFGIDRGASIRSDRL